MKKQVRRNVPEKYFKTLNEMFSNKLLNKTFEIQNLMKEKKINRGLPYALCEFKLLQKVGHNKWMWIGGRPTMEMTLEVIEFLRIKSERCNQNFKVEQPKIEQTLVKKRIRKPAIKNEMLVKKTGVIISLFWGLIKYQNN